MEANIFIDKLIQLQASAEGAGIKLVEVCISRDQVAIIRNASIISALYAYRGELLPLPIEGGVIGELVGIRLWIPAEALVLTVQPTQLSINTAQQQLADYAKKVRA